MGCFFGTQQKIREAGCDGRTRAAELALSVALGWADLDPKLTSPQHFVAWRRARVVLATFDAVGDSSIAEVAEKVEGEQAYQEELKLDR